MTNQEMFDKVTVHLLTQNWPSTPKPYYPESREKDYTCSYRGHMNGGVQLKCAIGCLIPDELYDPKIEGHGFRGLEQFPALKELFAGVDVNLGDDLQRLHDIYEPWEWKNRLRTIARSHKLSPAIIDKFPYF